MNDIFRSQAQWVRDASNMDPWLGMILFVAGLIYALLGWRIYRSLIILDCAAAGALIGAAVGTSVSPGSPIVGVGLGLVCAVILGLLAIPLAKPGVVLCSAIAGAFVGMAATSVVSTSFQVQMVGGAVGVLVAISLVFVVFQHVVIFVLGLQGALMAVAGALAAIGTRSDFFRHLRESAATSGWLAPFCVIAVTVIGVSIQMAGARETGGSTR